MTTWEIIYVIISFISFIIFIWMVVSIIGNKSEIGRLKKNNDSLWEATSNLHKDKIELIEKQKELETKIKELENK